MQSPSYASVILDLADQIDRLIQSFIANGYQALSQALEKPLGSVCVLYLILVGYGITRGFIKTPLQEFIKAALRMGVIYQLAMDWSFYASFVVDWFIKGMSELSAVMMQLLPCNFHLLKGAGVNGGLQTVLIEVVEVGSKVWNTASVRHPGPFFCGLMIYAGGIAVVALAFFELVVAKLMLALCLATAPLFVICTLFDKTRSFFDQWLGKVVGFALVIFFVSTVVGFCMHLLHWCIEDYVNNKTSYVAVGWIPLFICACLSVMALLEVVGLAKSIGGSCTTGTGSAMVGGFISGSLSALSLGGVANLLGRWGKTTTDKVLQMGAPYAGQTRDRSRMQAIQDKMRGQQE
jgi:type IV secretion system protein VirB6